MKSALYRKSFVLLLVLCVFAAHPALSQAPSGGSAPSVTLDPGVGLDANSSYVINPLDKLLIVIYAGDKQTGEYQKIVQSDGAVYLPFLERDVKISGMRLLEAERQLEELSRKVIREPRVVITIMSSYSQSVFTYGKIASSSVELNTPLRVLQLIARVGGPQEGAIEDSIRVISNDGSVRIFNYRMVNRDPSSEQNFLLSPGDIVYVPGANDFSVQVMGEVRTSGQYFMKNGDRILDAIVRAGSWNSSAELRKVRLLRNSQGKKVVREVNLKDIFEHANSRNNYVLEDGDVLFIPTKSQSRQQTLYMLSSITSSILAIIVVAKNFNE